MRRWQWLLKHITRRLWLRASLIGLTGVLAAILAAFAERFIPFDIPGSIPADAVDSILSIIASSMLAVTTFSLSVMTSAYGSATSNVTPRATRLLIEDRITQNVLSTFVGSFLFGIVGMVVLKTGAYGDRGRVVMFIVTIGVIGLIVVTLLRWIDHLTRLGRVGETTRRVEQATQQAMEARLQYPYLGGQVLSSFKRDIPKNARAIHAETIGYVQHIDMSTLSGLAETLGTNCYVAVNPGAFIYGDSTLAWVGSHRNTDAEIDIEATIRDAFTIGDERDFDQDPRFGLAVMSEIGLRALSPAMNDPGTAIDVIGRNTRLMALWAKGTATPAGDDIEHPRIYVPALKDDDMFEDAFMLVARDGAGMIEVQLRLQKALQALSRTGSPAFRNAARRQADMAAERARLALDAPSDKKRLGEVVADGEKPR